MNAFLDDFNDARAVWGRADAWKGDQLTLAQRAWRGLVFSATHAEKWGQTEQLALESAQVEFEFRQRLALSQ